MTHDGGLERWLRWRQVRDLTGLGRTTAWRMRQDGDFPDPVPISPGRVAWRERDIAAWTATRGVDPVTRPRGRPRSAPRPGLGACEPNPAPAPVDPPARQQPPILRKETAPRPRGSSRSRIAIAEGQLGFDF